MKIKLTLARYSGTPVDLIATVDAGATVGDLARHLLRVDPSLAGPVSALSGPRTPTLCLSGSNVALDAERRVADSGLRSGATVTITHAAAAYASAPDAPVTATVTIEAGPDQGRTFTIRGASGVIGRDRDCAVHLTDPMVSRQHARLNLGRSSEIVDLGSVNGIEINESIVTRAPLRAGDTVRLGDTEMSISLAVHGPTAPEGGVDGFIRSPRLNPQYTGDTLTAPEPPQRPAPARVPVIALLGPLLMGGVLYLVTKSITSLIFIGLSPLMMIGYVVENQIAGKSAFRKAVKQFEDDLEAMEKDATAAANEERVARNAEHPSLADCLDAVRRTSSLLWTRRPTDPGFMELRLGAGAQPSRNSIDLSNERNLPRDLVAQVRASVEKFTEVTDVPVVAQATEHGAIGVAGPRTEALDVMRGLVVQAVTLHSPAELVLTAFASTQSAKDWSWLPWLPHTTSAHSPLASQHLASTIESAAQLLSGLEDLLVQRQGKEAGPLPAVLVLVEDDAAAERTRSRLVELAEHGWEHGIHVLWIAPHETRLPAACRAYVSVTSPSTGVAGFVHTGTSVAPVAVERIVASDAMHVALRLSPLVDIGAKLEDDSDLPRAISLMHVAENPLDPTAAVILERWWQNDSIRTGPWAYRDDGRPRKDAALAAVIGRTADGAHRIDLRADGPHALVGGTTGAGKSELLQSWILALAAGYSPERLTFLLIDYKGGSAFKELKELPHQVGFVTDLDPHEVERAMNSLSAELKAREKLFSLYGVKDLVELEKRKDAVKVPPSLVIVVDEFAALVNELPEFVNGMINIAQRGRSLGVHLILATQQPAGVIKGNLRANTNLRLALRTADESDSTDVLGSPHAAFFDPKIPGRAVSKTGPGRLITFQAGYAGGWTRTEPDPPEIAVEELRFGARAVWEVPESTETPVDPGATDAQRLVAAMARAHLDAGLAKPQQPWKDPLAAIYNIADFTVMPNDRRDNELVFGMADLPATQQQLPLAFYPDTQGNLAVYGTGGAGKTTLLRTLAVSAGLAIQGGPCHVYALDFGARGLDAIADLPHVGAVIVGTDHDRITRLLTWLGDLVRDRADRFAAAGGASTISQYRSAPDGRPAEPRILLLVDGLNAFRQAYEAGERAKLFDLFCTIAADGRQVGVHVLLTADRPAALPSVLASVVQTRVILRMADANDYYGMSLSSEVLTAKSPPGRGLLDGVELQVAILGEQPDGRGQAEELRRLAADMKFVGVGAARPIAGLPDEVGFDLLPASSGDLPVLGLAAASLKPWPFRPEGSFLIVGPPMSGRTSAMRALAHGLRRWRGDARVHLLSANRKSTLTRSALWSTTAAGLDAVEARAKELTDLFRGGNPIQPNAVFIENVADLVNSDALNELVKVCLDEDVFVVADGDPANLVSNHGLLGMLKASRVGIALAPDVTDLGSAFRLQFTGRLNRADFPPGRALYVHAGRTSVVQVGWIGEE